MGFINFKSKNKPENNSLDIPPPPPPAVGEESHDILDMPAPGNLPDSDFGSQLPPMPPIQDMPQPSQEPKLMELPRMQPQQRQQIQRPINMPAPSPPPQLFSKKMQMQPIGNIEGNEEENNQNLQQGVLDMNTEDENGESELSPIPLKQTTRKENLSQMPMNRQNEERQLFPKAQPQDMSDYSFKQKELVQNEQESEEKIYAGKSVFIEVTKYKQILKELHNIKSSLKHSDDAIRVLTSGFGAEEKAFNEVSSQLSEIESKLDDLDGSIFRE